MKQNFFRKYFYFLPIITLFFFFSNKVMAQKTSIFDIARKGTLEQLKKIHSTNTDTINSISKEGYSPLTLACYYNNNEVAKYLAEHVKDIDSKSGYGTPLMAATVKRNTELVKLLIEKDANPNKTDVNGSTALHFSVIFSYEDIVELLINAKADKNLLDNRGKSAIDYAVITGNKKIIELLKQ
jgi:ankyrin repeat protein